MPSAEAYLVTSDGQPLNTVYHRLAIKNSTVNIDTSTIPFDQVGVLVVRSPHLGIWFRRIWPSDQIIHQARLTAPSEVSGSLKLPSGEPASGIAIRTTLLFREDTVGGLSYVFLNDECPFKLGSKASADGSFKIGGLSQGMEARCDLDDDRYAELPSSGQFKIGADGISLPHDFQLRPAAQVDGRVLRNGVPVPNILVSIQGTFKSDVDTSSRSVTDVHGHYSLKRLSPGFFNISTILSDEQQKEFTNLAIDSTKIDEGKIIDNLDLSLITGALIKGRVLDEDGVPIPNALVAVYGPAHPQTGAWVQNTHTDSHGYYSFRVPAGEQVIYLEEEGNHVERHIEVANGSVTTLELHR